VSLPLFSLLFFFAKRVYQRTGPLRLRPGGAFSLAAELTLFWFFSRLDAPAMTFLPLFPLLRSSRVSPSPSSLILAPPSGGFPRIHPVRDTFGSARVSASLAVRRSPFEKSGPALSRSDRFSPIPAKIRFFFSFFLPICCVF